jgi:AbiV family abortive infection protein
MRTVLCRESSPAVAELRLAVRPRIPPEINVDKSRLWKAMGACVDNGLRLQQDAETLRDYGPDTATTFAVCILAQEEFAKAFLLHLVCEGTIPWTDKVRDSLYKHQLKHLLGHIMEWLSPSDDDFLARLERIEGNPSLPTHVADAAKLYVERVQHQGQVSWPPPASDPSAKSIADGNRDKTKQDALYVRLSKDADVISVPTQITLEMIEAELDKTKRLGNLVQPLREGRLDTAFDYNLLREALDFLLLDKENRPFLILGESEFGGPTSSSTGTSWPHSIKVTIENISHEQATQVSGHAAIYLDREMVEPLFLLEQFAVEPHAVSLCTLFVSEEVYTNITSPSHKLEMSVQLEYRGGTSGRKYHVRMWSAYDAGAGAFREKMTDSQESVNGEAPLHNGSEVTWRRPTNT